MQSCLFITSVGSLSQFQVSLTIGTIYPYPRHWNRGKKNSGAIVSVSTRCFTWTTERQDSHRGLLTKITHPPWEKWEPQPRGTTLQAAGAKQSGSCSWWQRVTRQTWSWQDARREDIDEFKQMESTYNLHALAGREMSSRTTQRRARHRRVTDSLVDTKELLWARAQAN
jgi:hypothetical protein